MDTVTYPDDAVAGYLDRHFESLKIDLLARHPDFKQVIGNTKVLWSPVLLFRDATGRELRRTVGWLPPESFLAEMRFARALGEVARTRFDEARALFDEIVEQHGDTPVAPEALYWQGIVRFLAGKRDLPALRESWSRLVERYPQSVFATHASVIEDAPA